MPYDSNILCRGKSMTVSSILTLSPRCLLAGLMAVGAAFSLPAHAQKQKPPVQKMALQEVTVFLRGAELFSTGTVNLPAGETEVLLVNVAGKINEQSLSIGADNGVLVQSSRVQNDYLAEDTLSPQATDIKQQLEKAQWEKGKLAIQLEVIKEQLEILAGNRTLGGEKTGTSAGEIGKLLDLAARKMTELLNQRASLQQQTKELDEKIGKLQNQLAEEQGKGFQPGGQIAVRFYTPKAVTSRLNVSYVVPEAGWVPAYDLRVDKIGAPVKLAYKANVFQNSGISWDAVRLTLSTGNPAEGAQAPTLNPWYVSMYEPRPAPPAEAAPMAMMAGKPAAGSMAKSDVLRGRVQQQPLDGYVTTNANGINTSFDIALPYTVPSDGKGHIVLIKSAELQGDYRYAVMPKLDRDAFLQAQVSNWESLNLLPGKTNIFYEGLFIGQGSIDMRNARDGMSVSLGRDKKIIVSRDTDLNYTSKPEFFGSMVSRKFAYNISVKNTRKEPVKLVVTDQVPVSRDSEIEVIDLKHDGAELKKETGTVQWTLNLAPNEELRLPFSYTVKYPKDKQVIGL